MSLTLFSTLFKKIYSFTKCYHTHKLITSKLTLPVLNNINFFSNLSKPIEVNPIDKNEEKIVTESILKKVNENIINSPTRMFAVVHICGKQFKVTTNDVIIIEGYWPPDVGDKIRLDKVLCAGGENFSLIGTPLVQPGLVNIYATIIEKNLSHTKTNFRKKRRKQYKQIDFYRVERTMLRINEIGIGQLKDSIN